MKTLAMTLTVLPVVFLAACTPTTPTQQGASSSSASSASSVAMEQDDAMMKQEDGMMKKNEDTMMKKDEAMSVGAYTDATSANLSSSVLADGNTKVLFFHASWCPTCKIADTTLTSWYVNGEGMLTVYKINYDNEAALKQKYGVTYQHTFVKVDGEGNMIEKKQGPSDDVLKTLLKS